MNKPLVIGHRGAMGYETENTLASVRKALELNVDGIEVDVFKCKSGEIVAFHDKDLDRLTDGEGLIEDKTFDELQALTVNGGHQIPLLKDILNLVNGQCLINIELKGTDTANNVSKIVNMYLEFDMFAEEDIIISSFNWEELESFYKKNKNISIGVLTDVDQDPLEALQLAKKLKAKTIHAEGTTLDEGIIKNFRKRGLKVIAWFDKEPKSYKNILELRVHGIITDRPDKV
ncbi:MAG: glycerophosphodiester phosphodiesterase [Bacteroidia bacterium]|nr:glycerophosphodiester phosphodiesterase [Bacteroidia bacterium]NND11779.1 glycerophosphodiester phosphodiesterase [Flavobacteriaceae bacterium]